MRIVRFKRDLRIEDHEALFEASKRGPVLPLIIKISDTDGAV